MIGPKVAKPTAREGKLAYAAVAVRSAGRCEGCGDVAATQMHHRRYRSRGGWDTVVNLIHLCLACHGMAHDGLRGANLGWAVSASADPADVVLTYRGRRSRLHPDGRVEDMEKPF